MKRVTATVSTEIDLTPDLLAQAFCELDDDAQAQFFCRVGAIASATYTHGMFGTNGALNAETQWSFVGKHLRDCECSTDAGRAVVRAIFDSMTETKSTP